jgi:gallate decarboxylase subunit D
MGSPGEGREVSSFDVSESGGEFRVMARVLALGPDCLVTVWGGTRPHVGAVGMAQFRPSLKDPQEPAATSSVFTFAGHKEDMLAKSMSEELATRLQRNTVVVAGMHWDGLTDSDIDIVNALCRRLVDGIVRGLAGTAG